MEPNWEHLVQLAEGRPCILMTIGWRASNCHQYAGTAFSQLSSVCKDGLQPIVISMQGRPSANCHQYARTAFSQSYLSSLNSLTIWKKFKQGWSTIQTISTERTIIYHNNPLNTAFSQLSSVCKDALQPIVISMQGRPSANWTKCSQLGSILAVQVHTTTHSMSYREQQLDPHFLRQVR
jgi:hypothetical protein